MHFVPVNPPDAHLSARCSECARHLKLTATGALVSPSHPWRYYCPPCASRLRTWGDGSPRPLLSRELVGDTPAGAGWYVFAARSEYPVAYCGSRAEANSEVERLRGTAHGPARVETAARIDR